MAAEPARSGTDLVRLAAELLRALADALGGQIWVHFSAPRLACSLRMIVAGGAVAASRPLVMMVVPRVG